MKSPAFQWYAADYLADERVMLMSLEAEGAYVRLLSLCWREGSIPANPALLSAMCKGADLKVIKEVIPCFSKVGAPTGRLIHKRLEEERSKQETFKAKQAENGKLGGRPRKPTENPDDSQTKGLGFSGESQTKAKKRSTSTSSTTSTTTADAVAAPAAELAAPVEKLARYAEVPADEAPVFLAAGFRAFLAKLDYGPLDAARYLLDIQRKANEEPPRTNKGWENYIAAWLKRDYAAGLLLAAPGTVPTQQQRFGPPATASVATGSYDRAAIAAKQAQIVT